MSGLHIVPVGERIAEGRIVVSALRDVPRCSARTRGGGQCQKLVGGTGLGGDWRVIDGERVPLCSTHAGLPTREGPTRGGRA